MRVRGFRQLVTEKTGNVAMVFALSLVPIFGLAGMGVDTARLVQVRSALQAEADATALNGAVGGPQGNYTAQISAMNERVMSSFGNAGLSDLNINGSWSGLNFRVDANARVNTVLVHAVPGISDNVRVSVRATARLHQPLQQYEVPEVTWLDPDAGDYNRLYVYCFDPDPNSGKTLEERRTQRTPLQDNNGRNFLHEGFSWPRCERGETISFELYNVRFSRTSPQRAENPAGPPETFGLDTGSWCHANHNQRCRYRYFTDTVLVNGVERHTGLDFDILETVLCDTREQCSPGPESIIPTGTNRTPQKDTIGCTPGKYMYYGWEDRPPGVPGGTANWTYPGWTDRDYDDIRIVVQCPDYDHAGERYVRLVE
ncbi:MAG: hypothetical protein JJU26_11920 [Oceanicaulis sp.]|uniref:TadE/TadG family type IV pilus assembly protein n=1 Tax=Glycocaulis sp. TaxID=1969725 RepID=UPI0025C3A035|nr:pilus assembly protein TadG-related protein [Glycocaulis sp.]MCC5982413.1 hypothetical protein [Oceanicaulis sp.]MCH8521567.1 Tad domain-containing protein [Glycocaulis sp.]